MVSNLNVVAPYHGFREQEPHLLHAITQAPLSLCKFWVDGTLVSVVEGGERLGFNAGTGLAKHYREAFKETPELVMCIDTAYSGIPVSQTLTLGGTPWDARFFPTHNPERGVIGVVGILTDASDRVTAFRLLRTLDILASVSQWLTRSSDEAEFLHQICNQIELTHAAAWVGLIDRTDSTRTIRVLSGQGPATGFLLDQDLVWDASTKTGHSMASEAIRKGKTRLTNDVLTSAECSLWYNEATKHGWKSALALPLLADGVCLGVLMLFSTDTFDEQELPRWEQIATEIVEGIAVLRERIVQKGAMLERRETDDNYRRLVETAFDIVIVHQDLKIVDINAAGVKHAGAWSREALIGAPLMSLITPEDRRRIITYFSADQTEAPLNDVVPIEFQLLGLNASVTSVEGVTVSVNHLGAPAKLSVMRDISQRKNQEKALSSAKASLDYAQRVANMGSVVLDLASGEAEWSENAFQILGVHEPIQVREEFFVTLRGAIGAAESDKIIALHDRIRINGTPSKVELCVQQEVATTSKTLHIHGIPMHEANGRIQRIFFVLQDLTRKRVKPRSSGRGRKARTAKLAVVRPAVVSEAFAAVRCIGG
jgi:PAS domain S-box-containing protein